MASFYDNDFSDDGGGPGPTWEEINGQLTDFMSIDRTSATAWQQMNTDLTDFFPYNKTGEGDSFKGEDPSVFDGEGDFVDEQSADTPSGGVSFGRNDDPDTVENPGDVEYGDDEEDGPPKPEEVISTTDLGEDEPDWLIENEDLFDETDVLNLYDELLRDLSTYEDEDIEETIRNLRDSLALEVKDAEYQEESWLDILLAGPPTLRDIFDIPTKADILDMLQYPTRQDAFDYFGINPPSKSDILDYFGIPTKNDIYDFLLGDEVEFVSDPDDYFDTEDYDQMARDIIRGTFDIMDYTGDVELYSLIEEFSYNEPDDLYY